MIIKCAKTGLVILAMVLGACASQSKVEDESIYKIIAGSAEDRAEWFDGIHGQDVFENRYREIAFYLSKYPVDYKHSRKIYMLLAEMISYSYADYAGYWDATIDHDGRPVFQNHDLFEMDRLDFPESRLNTRSGSDYETHTNNPYKAAFEDFNFSRERMRKGQPAIGPDGREIVLCALLPIPNSALYELSNVDAERLKRRMPKEAQMGISCHNQVRANYWKDRRKQFIDGYGIERPADDKYILP